jgi:hypothetical protein
VDGEASSIYRHRWRVLRLNYLFVSIEFHNIPPVSRCSWVGGTLYGFWTSDITILGKRTQILH